MRRLPLLCLLAALAGCAPSWVPLIGRDPEPAAGQASAAETAAASGENDASKGPCTRKGRRWAEGSRVCEDHTVTRCFSDGTWRVIGTC